LVVFRTALGTHNTKAATEILVVMNAYYKGKKARMLARGCVKGMNCEVFKGVTSLIYME